MAQVEVSNRFELEKRVCNHGFFMMAPNRWIPSTKTLVRPLHLPPSNHSVTVSISQPAPNSLSITTLDDISSSDHQAILDQVKRMLRLSKEEDDQLREFHKLHVDAANRGFGHLFRNPSLFEDVVKSLLLCGCKFERSLEMAQGLCIIQKQLNHKGKQQTKRKRGTTRQEGDEELWGNFPTAQELASLEIKDLLNKNCNLGYRARYVLRLAKGVANGEIELLEFQQLRDSDELYRKLMRMYGFGEFVTCNVLMCLGLYASLPVDSETIRHIKQIHQREECEKKNVKAIIKEIYDKYAPFQSLTYWLELVEYYEKKLGKLSLLERCHYKNVTGRVINKCL